MNANVFDVVKARTTHNPIADVYSVNEAPGQGYAKWIIVTRKKLRERESNLLSIRMDLVKRVIYRTIQEFNSNSLNIKYGIKISIKHIDNMFEIINDNLINVSIEYLKTILSHWNGVDLARSTKQFTTFRKYFIVSKNWFDHRKKSVLTEHFWLKILHAIQEFSRNVASEYFYKYNDLYFYKYLLFKLMNGIFSSKTQFSSTKPQPLIPGGTIKDTIDIRQWLENIDESLTLSLKTNDTNKKTNDMSAKQCLNIILNQLNVLTVQYENIFHNSLCINNITNINNNNNNNKNTNLKTENNVEFSNFYDDNLISNDFSLNDFSPNDSPLICTPFFPTNNNFNTNNQRISNPFLPNINNVNNNNNNFNTNNFSYGPVHSSNVYVSSENRHNPLNYYQYNESNNNTCKCYCNNCNIIA